MTKLLIKLFLAKKDLTTHSGREACGKLAGTVGVICNIILSILKFTVGITSKSISITADAVNNISDAGSSVVTFVGFRLSGKPADKDHPYGHARMEYVSGLIVSFLILMIGFSIAKSSVDKIIHPVETVFELASVFILIISILVKLWMAFFNKKLGRMIKSKAIEATAADSRNDVITTAFVLIALIITRFTGINLDGYMGLGVSIFIIISGYKLVRETIDPLLGQAPDKDVYDLIENKIKSYDLVLGVHDLLVHSYGPGSYFASAHVEMDASIDSLHAHDVMDKIERDFHEEYDIHLVVHLDPTITDDEETNEMKKIVTDAVSAYSPELTMHDFRVVTGAEHKNVLFDVVVPPEFGKSDNDVKDELTNIVNGIDSGRLFAVITIDHSYGIMS